jgi:hypothetical protein
MRSALVLALLSALSVHPLAAQEWNSDSALALARRAVERRTAAARDTGLRDYKARAHGFLFALGQLGDGPSESPRLLKTDQLELEVYWKAPRLSKQRIVGWRDRAETPTDMTYHEDHLGIVQNNFGPVIRLGDGDEVRDVPHPLGPVGMALYDFALGDTLEIALPERSVRVIALAVRPRAFSQPRIVGTLYADAQTADLVRMSFSFTPAAYVDHRIEDLSIVLDNALWEGRWWLPYRQELEIRRRERFFDMSARFIIRGRWEVDHYVFNLGLVDSWFRGREISAVPRAERDSFPWTEPIEEAAGDVAEPVRENDLERVREEVRRVAGRQALSGLSPRRLGVRRLSDLVHANRVEGLTLGLGVAWHSSTLLVNYGLSDQRLKGAITLSDGHRFALRAYREVRDVADEPVIAPLLNSIASQEMGRDYGDYYLAEGAHIGFRDALGSWGEWNVETGYERIGFLAIRARPASGTWRPNPALGGRPVSFVRAGVRRSGEGLAVRSDFSLDIAAELGWPEGGSSYARARAAARALVPLGGTRLLVRAHGGIGTRALPPHRAFVLGGRGTLPGDAFRSWGGRRALLGHVEWRIPLPAPSFSIGPQVRVPVAVTLAPFIAAGWTSEQVANTPWRATPGARITAGLAVECFGLLRFEIGTGLQSRRARFVFDLTRDFWDML